MNKIAALAFSALALGAVALGGSHALTTDDSESRQLALRIGGSEAAGFFKEATGFDSESEVTAVRR